MTFDELNEQLTPRGDITSIMSDDERRFIWKAVEETAPLPVLEIGSAYGGTTAVMCAAAGPERRVYSIDQWIGEDVYDRFNANLTKLGLLEQVSVIRRPSQIAFSGLPTESFGVVLIDADHDGDAPVRDLSTYANCVGRGGYLLVDDIFNQHVDVTLGLIEWLCYARGRFAFQRVFHVEGSPYAKLIAFRRIA